MFTRQNIIQSRYRFWIVTLLILIGSVTLSGCESGSGFIIFIIIIGVIVYWASKAVKGSIKSSKSLTADMGKQDNQVYDEETDEMYDLENGYEFRVATTWDMQAHAQAGEWVISDQPIDFKGMVITNPMFYMGKIPQEAYPDPALINPSLPISKEIKGYVQDLGYWPSYKDMTPGQRRVFVEWQATGRKDPTINTGYVFVHYYGLERRLLVDQQNIGEIVSELHRLRSIYENRSFQSYSSNLLAFNSAKTLDKIAEDFLPEAFPPSYGAHGYSEEILNAVLCWYILNSKPLSWKWALVVTANDPRSPSSVVTQRVKDEFEQLFKKRYEEKCGDGIFLKSAKRHLALRYNPASASLSSMSRFGDNAEKLFNIVLPNALGITSQFKPLIKIWTQCIEDLKAFSRQQAKMAGDEPLTAEAWEKLPPELQAQFDHPESGVWSKVIEKHIDEGTVAWVPVNEFAVLKEIPVRDKLTVGQSTKIAETAASLGYAIEPDARLVRKGYPWSDKLAVYKDPMPNEHLDAKSSYSAASVMLHLAMSIAAADGNVDPRELETITTFLDNQFDLSDSERRRLTACGNYFIESNITLVGIGKRIQAHLNNEQRHKVGRFLVAVAAADGVFEKSEITALKKAYKAMGMDPNDAVDEVEIVKAVSAEQGEPVVVQKGKPGKQGETIPPKPVDMESTEPVKLNPKAIAKIIDDTRDVGQMLGAVLAENEEDEPDTEQVEKPSDPVQEVKKSEISASAKVPASPQQQSSTAKTEATKQVPPAQPKAKPKISIAALPAEYRPFVKDVIRKTKWTEPEIRILADKHNIMVNAAIDAINEWSEDELGDFLIDCDNPYTIQCELLKR